MGKEAREAHLMKLLMRDHTYEIQYIPRTEEKLLSM